MKNRFLLILAFVFLVAIYIRLASLEEVDLWVDEWHLLKFSTQNSFSDFFADYASYNNNQQPLYYFFHYLFFHFFNPYTEFVVRFPALLFGILTIPILYLIVKNIFNQEVALYSSILLSFNFFHIRYSVEARPYSLVILISIFSLYWFWLFIKKYNLKKRFFLFVTNILLYFTFPLTIIFIFIEYAIIYISFFKKIQTRSIRSALTTFFKFFLAEVVFFLLAVFMRIPLFIDRRGIQWIQKPHFKDLLELYSIFLQYTYFKNSLLLLFLFLFILFIVAVKRREVLPKIYQIYFNHKPIILLLIVTVSFIPMVTIGISLWKPIYVFRYQAIVLIPLVIMLSVILSVIPNISKKSILCLLVIFSLYSFLDSKKFNRIDCEYNRLFSDIKYSQENYVYASFFPDTIENFFKHKNNFDYHNIISVQSDDLSDKINQLSNQYNDYIFIMDWGVPSPEKYLSPNCSFDNLNLKYRCFETKKINCINL